MLFLYKPHTNHRAKIYSRYTRGKKKSKAYCYRKPTKQKENKTKLPKELQNSQKTRNKMPITPHLSIITLNVNGLNSPIKRYSVDGQI